MTDSVIQGEVKSLAFGGNGILRKDDLVVFVPFSAPGDLLSCRITKKKSTYAIAEIVNIDSPSKERVEPCCPYFGTCGGCQLQHINYEAQLEYKRQAVEDALNRIGHLNVGKLPPVVAATEQWAYRRNIHLNMRPVGNRFETGYIAVDNRSVVKAEACPIFVSESEIVLKQLQDVCRQLIADPKTEGKVTILKKDENQFVFHFHFKISPKNIEGVIKKALSEWKSWVGVVVSTPKKRTNFGNTQCELKIDQLTFHFSTDAFIQNHPEQSVNIYKYLCKIAENVKALRVLDLYCGVGCTSLLLAKQVEKVVGVENNREGVRLAKDNARSNGLANVEFLCADVQKALGESIEKLKPDFVVVNPPRIGLDKRVVEDLIKYQPANIVYISCMPATLARDLQVLAKNGYRLDSVLAFDMFPQTAHVETVVHLKRERSQESVSRSQ